MEPNNLNTTVVATPAPVNPVVASTITSPVTPQPEVQYASFWRRFGASFIDSFIIGFFNFIASIFFGTVTNVSASRGYSLSGIPALIFFLLVMTYYIFLIGKFGQTLGKMIMKVKVVIASDNSIPGYLSAFLREVVGKFLSSIIILLGFLWMLWDPKKQTWHDKIANTIVIKV